MGNFDESNSDFYDLEYFISMEYRYLSGAHSEKPKHVLKILGDLNGKKVLDVGCGGGFFANEFACVVGQWCTFSDTLGTCRDRGYQTVPCSRSNELV